MKTGKANRTQTIEIPPTSPGPIINPITSPTTPGSPERAHTTNLTRKETLPRDKDRDKDAVGGSVGSSPRHSSPRKKSFAKQGAVTNINLSALGLNVKYSNSGANGSVSGSSGASGSGSGGAGGSSSDIKTSGRQLVSKPSPRKTRGISVELTASATQTPSHDSMHPIKRRPSLPTRSTSDPSIEVIESPPSTISTFRRGGEEPLVPSTPSSTSSVSTRKERDKTLHELKSDKHKKTKSVSVAHEKLISSPHRVATKKRNTKEKDKEREREREKDKEREYASPTEKRDESKPDVEPMDSKRERSGSSTKNLPPYHHHHHAVNGTPTGNTPVGSHPSSPNSPIAYKADQNPVIYVTTKEADQIVSPEEGQKKTVRSDKKLEAWNKKMRSVRENNHKSVTFMKRKLMRQRGERFDGETDKNEGEEERRLCRGSTVSGRLSQSLLVTVPFSPESPVKSKKWALMSIDKVKELGIDAITFLNELHDLLLDDKDAQVKFLENNGFEKLLGHLLNSDVQIVKKILEIILDSIQEKEIFTSLFINGADTLTKITHILLKHKENMNLKMLVYQILSALAEIPLSLELTDFDVQATILCAINYYKSKSTEKHRFEHLVTNLCSETSPESPNKMDENSEYTALAIFRLINTIIDGNEVLEERIKLRCEFRDLGLDKLVDSILSSEKFKESMLLYHVQAFKMSRELDNNQRMSSDLKFLMEQSEAAQILDEIVKKYGQHTHIQNLLVNILQSMSKLQVDDASTLPKWLLSDKLISEICTEENNISELIKEGKISIEKGLEIKKLFLASANEENLKNEVKKLEDERVIMAAKLEQLQATLQKKNSKISVLKKELAEESELLEDTAFQLEESKMQLEESRVRMKEVDAYLDEYDIMLDEYEAKLQKSEDDHSKTKTSLDQKTAEIRKLLEEFGLPLNEEEGWKALRLCMLQEHSKPSPGNSSSISSGATVIPVEDTSGIPKWKLKQQLMDKEVQERRERERAAKTLKVNSIRKRIKEIGHDAVDDVKSLVSPSAEHSLNGHSYGSSFSPSIARMDSDGGVVAVAPLFHTAKQNLEKKLNPLSRIKSNPSYTTIQKTASSVLLPTLTANSYPTTLQPSPKSVATPREDELLSKMEKLKAKKKQQQQRITKLEQESQMQRMQLLALEKEKEARQRDEKRIQIKMQRTEEEKENVLRQRQTVQEEMKKWATQREKMDQEFKKEKLQIAKMKQEVERLKQLQTEEQDAWEKEQQNIRNELEMKIEQLRIERELFEEEVLQLYMEDKEDKSTQI